MNDKQLLAEYYNKKAQEYEEVYSNLRPDKNRLKEQEIIKQYIEAHFKNHNVLELACGTGYWTKSLLDVASKVLAIDQSKEMLTIASKRYGEKPNVQFILGDAYNPPVSFPQFTGCMTNFLFSHIPKDEIDSFLELVHQRLNNNAFVMFTDSNYVEGQGGVLVKKEHLTDTWKRRKLNNGEEFDVLKNYYTKDALENIFSKYAKNLEIQYMTNFWIVGYYIK